MLSTGGTGGGIMRGGGNFEFDGILVGIIGGMKGGGRAVEGPTISKPGGIGGAVFIIGGGRRRRLSLEGFSSFDIFGEYIGGGGGPFGSGLFGNLFGFEGGGGINEG